MKNNRLFGQFEIHGAGNIGRGLLALALGAALAGCSKAPGDQVDVTPTSFRGDRSKMPANVQTRIGTQQAQVLAEQAKHQ